MRPPHRTARPRRGSRTRRRRGRRRSTGPGRRRGSARRRRRRAAPAAPAAAGSVSWYSSTKIRRGAARSAASSAGSSRSAFVAARISSAGSYAPGSFIAYTAWYSARNSPRRDPVGAAWPRPSSASAGPSRPRSTARMSRSRSSPAKPRVASAGRSSAGQRCGVAGEQFAEHDVLFGCGQQPRVGQPAGDVGHAQHAECVGVQRAGDRLAQRAAEPGGDTITQLTRGAAAEGQHQHASRPARPCRPGPRPPRRAWWSCRCPGRRARAAARRRLSTTLPLGGVEHRHRRRRAPPPNQPIPRCRW